MKIWGDDVVLKKKKPKAMWIKKAAVFIIFLAVAFALIYNLQIIPSLVPLAKAEATTEITAAVNRIIRDCLRNENCDYSNIVRLAYDTGGNVVSVETDTVKMADLISSIVETTADTLGGGGKLKIQIPAGNLSGGALLTGKGPNIEINVAVSQKISCTIKNEFYESGINQTLHRILLNVETETYALLPARVQKFQVTTEYCIAETVIVGKVPDAYTHINRMTDDIKESDIDDIYDFGAFED